MGRIWTRFNDDTTYDSDGNLVSAGTHLVLAVLDYPAVNPGSVLAAADLGGLNVTVGDPPSDDPADPHYNPDIRRGA